MQTLKEYYNDFVIDQRCYDCLGEFSNEEIDTIYETFEYSLSTQYAIESKIDLLLQADKDRGYIEEVTDDDKRNAYIADRISGYREDYDRYYLDDFLNNKINREEFNRLYQRGERGQTIVFYHNSDYIVKMYRQDSQSRPADTNYEELGTYECPGNNQCTEEGFDTLDDQRTRYCGEGYSDRQVQSEFIDAILTLNKSY